MARMDFLSFNCEFIYNSNMTRAEVAVYAPLIYGFEDKYFDACVAFLKTGEKQDIWFENYSIDRLQSGMRLSYIQALVVLHNIQSMPQEAARIYRPIRVE